MNRVCSSAFFACMVLMAGSGLPSGRTDLSSEGYAGANGHR